ncbi:MAG: hypothetical protein H6734_18535 [Alphaproteobacteria bacterium]|nr:hypothetical protein [Alphaproteobacteria bacterium]
MSYRWIPLPALLAACTVQPADYVVYTVEIVDDTPNPEYGLELDAVALEYDDGGAQSVLWLDAEDVDPDAFDAIGDVEDIAGEPDGDCAAETGFAALAGGSVRFTFGDRTPAPGDVIRVFDVQEAKGCAGFEGTEADAYHLRLQTGEDEWTEIGSRELGGMWGFTIPAY